LRPESDLEVVREQAVARESKLLKQKRQLNDEELKMEHPVAPYMCLEEVKLTLGEGINTPNKGI